MDPMSLTWINIPAIVKKRCVLKVDPGYHTELCQLHNDYPLASDKIAINKEYCPNIS